MHIKLASHTGFCFGVKRAINIAEKVLGDKRNRKYGVYSVGSLIHNPQVVMDLSQKGLKVLKSIDSVKKGAVIISSHGASKDVIEKLKKKNITIVDATCPFVKNAQDIVKDLNKKGYRIVIVGDKEHPEVMALSSLFENRGTTRNVTQNKAEVVKKIGIISQTTQNKEDYIRGILEVLKNGFSEARIFNTICKDTSRRQELTRRLIKECDVMIIVGGRNSANTKRLWHICRESGVDSYHIETDSELRKDYFTNKKCAGVVSGASAPDEMVKRVVKKIKEVTK